MASTKNTRAMRADGYLDAEGTPHAPIREKQWRPRTLTESELHESLPERTERRKLEDL